MVLRILRLVLSLLMGQIVSKLISFGCLIFLARRFGVEGLGAYGAVMAYLTIASAFADGGLSTVVTRELAQDASRSSQIIPNAFALRLLLNLAAYSILLLTAPQLNSSSLSPWLIYGIFLFPEALRKLSSSALSAYERMDVIAALDALSTFCRYLPFLVAAFLGQTIYDGLYWFGIVWLGVAAVWAYALNRFCLADVRFSAISLRSAGHLMYEALPFGLLHALSLVYTKTDIIMLTHIENIAAVGFYEAAYKFIEAAKFIPITLVTALLPVMSRLVLSDKELYTLLYVHATRILAIFMLPVAIGVSLFAREIVLFIYNDAYLPSAPALAILIWTLFIFFLNAPVGNVVAMSRRMYAFLPYAFGNVLLNIVLNALFIPRYGFVGASIATLIAECSGFVIQFWFAHSIIKSAKQMASLFGKLAIAGLLTASVSLFCRSTCPWPLTILALCMMYGASLLLLKIVQPQDQRVLFELIGSLKHLVYKEN